MAVMKVAVVKAGGASIDVDTDKIENQNVYAYIFELGLKALLNRGTTKITKASIPNDAERHKVAMETAEKQLQAIYEGKIRIVGSKAGGKESGEVMTEARRIARNMVKDAMKANKIKVSHVAASEITKAANALIAADKSIIDKAKASLEARKAEGTSAEALTKLVGAIPVDQKLVAAAEAKKKKGKEGEPLSATQAGQTTTRKTKPSK